MSLKNKKGALQGLKLIFSIVVIVFLLIIFYVWIKDNVENSTKNQAETIAVEVELQNFFSELIKKHGIELSTKNAENIIESFAASYITFPKGSYDASCSGNKDCTLVVTVNEKLSTIATLTYFVYPVNLATAPIQIAIRLIGLDILRETKQEAYLPVKPAQAIPFSLAMKVKWI
jgi:hypothetical protein